MVLKSAAALFALPMLILAGCATSVSFTVQKAPAMDTSGIRRVAVMPFETGSNTRLQREIAQFITATAVSKIRAANYFTLVDHSEIRRLQQNGENIENHVDALFTGQIISMIVKDGSRIEERYEQKTATTYNVAVYDREVELTFNYRLIRARDGSIIDVITKTGRKQTRDESREGLESPLRLLQDIVTGNLAHLAKDVAPYNAVETRTLMTEKSGDKELKAKMKDVLGYVKSRNYTSALAMYRAIHEEYDNFAAAYNAAVLYEAAGNLSAAAALMEKCYNETGNPRARDAVNRLNRGMREQDILAAGYNDKGYQRDRVIAHAVEEIHKILPQGAKLWIINNSGEEKALADSVTDGITSGLVKKGVTVVDRDNSNLVEAEHAFQMSGNVGDNDFVSIGRAAGANTLVTVAITGISSSRRLQIRVVDIGKRTNLLQSDAGDNWKL